MANVFSLILVVCTLITGVVWALDKLMWAPRRAATIAGAKATSNVNLGDDVLNELAPEPSWIETCRSIFPVIGAVLVLRSFIYEPFQIPSGSMLPTLLVGDFILVEKYAYGLKDPVFRNKFIETGAPKHGDVAVFKYPENTNIDYIKRIVGLPGDRIIYKDKQLYVQKACDTKPCAGMEKLPLSLEKEGEFYQGLTALKEYQEKLGENTHNILINPMRPDNIPHYFQQPGTAPVEWIVPKGHYFAMGDNRDNSKDSRYWGFVSDDNLVGKAVAIWMSFEFDRGADSLLPGWVPTGVRFGRLGGIE